MIATFSLPFLDLSLPFLCFSPPFLLSLPFLCFSSTVIMAATELFNHWEIGEKETGNGLLILYIHNDGRPVCSPRDPNSTFVKPRKVPNQIWLGDLHGLVCFV